MSVEHLKLAFRSIKGYCSENESQLFSVFYDENPLSSGLMFLHLEFRVAKKYSLLEGEYWIFLLELNI